jgi:hypothetical protein
MGSGGARGARGAKGAKRALGKNFLKEVFPKPFSRTYRSLDVFDNLYIT